MCTVGRFVLVAVFLLAGAASVFADPRLVRVIWDVGNGKVYHKPESRTTTGNDSFTVPANAVAAGKAGFGDAESFDIVRKGDRVRLYVVNYNSVSHVWHDSSTVEQILPDPSIVAILTNAALMSITGGKALPAAAFSVPAGALIAPPIAECRQVAISLDRLRDEALTVNRNAIAMLANAKAASLPADQKKIASVPTNRIFWAEYRNDASRNLLLTNTEVFGKDFAAEYKEFAGTIATFDKSVAAASAALLAFDAENMQVLPPANCKTLSAARDIIQEYLRGATAADSQVGQLITQYKSAASLWQEYLRKLTEWNDVVEVPVKDPVQNEAVVRLDAVFVSPDPKFTERSRKSLAIRAERFFPVLTISTGVGFNHFNFKKLQIAQGVMDGAVKSKLLVVDDTTWDPVTPVWTQNIRLVAGKEAGLYFMFGTTPDRNIFKNAIFGFSAVVPRWRTSFAVGGITARGYEESDLSDVVDQFTNKTTGFVLDGTDVGKLPMPKVPWKVSPYASVTLMLVSF